MRRLTCCFTLFSWLFIIAVQQVIAQQVRPVKVNESNAYLYRDSLKKAIFGTTAFPYGALPDFLITNVNSIDHYNGFPYTPIMYPLGNLDSVDKIVITIDTDTVYFPEKATAYLFHPHNSNGKLFIYHSGHCTGVAPAEDVQANNSGSAPGLVIPALIAKGYTVLAVPMIYYKFNIPIGLYCSNNGHDELFTDNHYPYPLRFFFKPLIASLNLLGRSNYNAIYMCGLSGGGWTTSIYPAIDTSISIAVPAAGSWPMAVRAVFYPQLGDEEQRYPTLFSELLDYHDIYTLACLKPSRKMLQINNRYDPCCFAGAYAHIYYADSVKKALLGTGAVFKFYLDETGTTHSITEKGLQVMLSFIENETAGLRYDPPDSTANGSNYFYDIKSNFGVENSDPDPAMALRYSLLKAPGWLSMDTIRGQLKGTVPPGNIIVRTDTISFKTEDPDGRFVIHDFTLIRSRQGTYFFSNSGQDSILYMLPPYSNSLGVINPQIIVAFHFNDPLLHATSINVENNSIVRFKMSRALAETDSVYYNGFNQPGAITYTNGRKLTNIPLSNINLNAVTKKIALAGMIRFNKDSMKFEYFNGTSWIILNQ